VSFLEVNPLVIESGKYYFLDLAVEVDSAAEFFVPAGRQGAQNGWSASDFVGEIAGTTQEEQNIIALKAKSQAAFKFDLLNPDGSIWMLLSGGGASIVLADEVYNLGKGKDLANYGEYSGNPNQEETYIYTKNLLSLLLKSSSSKKALIIGGGVANFTDIRATFKGVVKALEEVKEKLADQQVKVFVRRGGPNQRAGLDQMKNFLESAGILGGVWDPTLVITDIVERAIEYLTL
jgi:ATP citrate (pro-S)-lyase